MTNEELGKHLARKLFECGCHDSRKVSRIEFKTGDRWNNTEFGLGGFCETALADFFEGVLTEAQRDQR